MRLFLRTAALIGVISALWSCDDDDQAGTAARIQAFSATPSLIVAGETAQIRWHVVSGAELRLAAFAGSAMPDATQPWVCTSQGGDQVCTAPTAPADPSGWSCETVEGVPTCRRPVEQDAEYRPVSVIRELNQIGALAVIPDTTTTYRLEARGTAGGMVMAWAQVVVDDTTPPARILDWTAWPSPALAGEQVTLAYRTEGCDQVDYSATPAMRDEDWQRVEGYTNESGTIIWESADETRDFYFGCHPVGAVETARIRSHITVVVLQQPEVCPRIDLFEVNPSELPIGGGTVTISWRVSNSAWVEGEGFTIGSVAFSGTRDVAVGASTTFGIIAHPEGASNCSQAEATVTVTVEGTEPDGDADVDGDVDGDADGDVDSGT